MKFSEWLYQEIADFGFDKPKEDEGPTDEREGKPLRAFDTELMMRFLSRHKIGVVEAVVPFMNEIQWGNRCGAVKLEVNNRMQFLFHKLGRDLEGNPRWVTKKTFQLNRRGYGGFEESVAEEVYKYIQKIAQGGLEGPDQNFDKLPQISEYIAAKLKQSAKSIFIYEGIKKVNDQNYQIIFGVRGQGVQAPGQKRVEQNVTDLSYDEQCGTIRIRNYNIESPVGRAHSWSVMPAHLDLYFFPSQHQSEMAEPLSVHLKYY